MSNRSEAFLLDLEGILSVPRAERYEKFLLIIDKYDQLKSNKFRFQSLDEFDKIHGALIDLLVVNDENFPIDLSKFDHFQSIMKDLRRTIETLVIESYIQGEKLNNIDREIRSSKEEIRSSKEEIRSSKEEIRSLKEEINELKQLNYEREFQKLLFGISTPLKNMISQRFRRETIRMDPLEEDLLDALLHNDCPPTISKNKFKEIQCIYEEISDCIGISCKQLIDMMRCRKKRNAEHHELFNDYIRQCERSHMEIEFSGLLQHLYLVGLSKYKEHELKTLEKTFRFFVKQGEYR